MDEVYTAPTLNELIEKSIRESPKNSSEIKLRTHGRIDAAALAANFQKGINKRFAEQDKKTLSSQF